MIKYRVIKCLFLLILSCNTFSEPLYTNEFPLDATYYSGTYSYDWINDDTVHAIVVDDFSLQDKSNVLKIEWHGYYPSNSTRRASDFELLIYPNSIKDGRNVPDSDTLSVIEIYQLTGVETGINNGNEILKFSFELENPLLLESGHYWICVRARIEKRSFYSWSKGISTETINDKQVYYYNGEWLTNINQNRPHYAFAIHGNHVVYSEPIPVPIKNILSFAILAIMISLLAAAQFFMKQNDA